MNAPNPAWRAGSRRSALMPIAVFAGVAVFAIFLGLLVAIGRGLPVVVLAVTVVIAIYLASRYGLAAYHEGANGPFWTALILSLVLGVAELIAPMNVAGGMEIWLICLVPWIIWSGTGAVRREPLLRVFFALFLVALLLSVVSTLLMERINGKAAVYQFAYNLKWPLMLLLGYRVCWQDADHALLRKVVWAFVVVAAVFVALDVAVPSVFKAIARNVKEYHGTSNPLLGGNYFRLTGPFIHPSVLAYFSTIFLVMTAVQRSGKLVGLPYTILTMAALLVLLALSGQMQETAAAVAGCGLVWATFRARNLWTVAALSAIVLLITAAALIGVIGLEKFRLLGVDWGLAPSWSGLTQARPVLYTDAFRLASEHWPVGTGLGTFAGEGARLFNRDLYESLGYNIYWWYQRDIFLVDTYWPNFIAEIGWIGTVCLMLVPLLAIVYSLWRVTQSANPRVKVVWGYAFVGQFVPLIVSLTSPIFSDPNSVAFAFMMLGMAQVYERRLSRKAVMPQRRCA